MNNKITTISSHNIYGIISILQVKFYTAVSSMDS